MMTMITRKPGERNDQLEERVLAAYGGDVVKAAEALFDILADEDDTVIARIEMETLIQRVAWTALESNGISR